MDTERSFIISWRCAVGNSDEPAAAKLCLLALAEWADRDGGNCFPSMESVAKWASFSERTVRRHLLENRSRFFKRKAGGGVGKGWRTSSFQLVIPDGADTSSARSSSSRRRLTKFSAEKVDSRGLCVRHVRTQRPTAPDRVSGELSNDLSKDLARNDSHTASKNKASFGRRKATLEDAIYAIQHEYQVFGTISFEQCQSRINELRRLAHQGIPSSLAE